MHECTNSTPSVPSGMLISPCTLTPTHRSNVARFCGDADHLELLGRIGPSSVERLQACGALKLQRHFINQPKNNLLHAAAMQESSDLVQAINRYGIAAEERQPLVLSLSAPSDTGETALTMATISSREIHTHYILSMVADCMRSDDVFFVQRCRDGVVFRSELTSLLDTVAIEETNLQKKKKKAFRSYASLLDGATSRERVQRIEKEHPERQTGESFLKKTDTPPTPAGRIGPE